MILLIHNFKSLYQSLFVFRSGAAEWLSHQTTADNTAEVRKTINTMGSPEYNLYRLHNTFSFNYYMELKISIYSKVVGSSLMRSVVSIMWLSKNILSCDYGTALEMKPYFYSLFQKDDMLISCAHNIMHMIRPHHKILRLCP